MLFDPFDQTFRQRWRRLKINLAKKKVELGVSLNGDVDWVKKGERSSVCLVWKGGSPRAINKLGLTLPYPPFWTPTPRPQKRYLSWEKADGAIFVTT